jgi:hypothetical protein
LDAFGPMNSLLKAFTHRRGVPRREVLSGTASNSRKAFGIAGVEKCIMKALL